MLLRRMFVVVWDQNIQMRVLCQGKGWWGLVSQRLFNWGGGGTFLNKDMFVLLKVLLTSPSPQSELTPLRHLLVL